MCTKINMFKMRGLVQKGIPLVSSSAIKLAVGSSDLKQLYSSLYHLGIIRILGKYQNNRIPISSRFLYQAHTATLQPVYFRCLSQSLTSQ